YSACRLKSTVNYGQKAAAMHPPACLTAAFSASCAPVSFTPLRNSANARAGNPAASCGTGLVRPQPLPAVVAAAAVARLAAGCRLSDRPPQRPAAGAVPGAVAGPVSWPADATGTDRAETAWPAQCVGTGSHPAAR